MLLVILQKWVCLLYLLQIYPIIQAYDYWLEGKLAVSGVTVVFLVAYLSGGRRRAVEYVASGGAESSVLAFEGSRDDAASAGVLMGLARR